MRVLDVNENLPFQIIGHRGCAALEPENTLRGIRRAIEIGCTMIEVDVHLVEGRLVVIHDFSVDRTTNGRGELTDMNLDYLRSLDAGKGEKVPLLEEVLECCESVAKVNVELKGENCSETLIGVLTNCPTSNVIVSSFDWNQLRQFHTLSPETETAVLVDKQALVRDAFRCARELSSRSINPSIRLLTQDLVKTAHAEGLEVSTFTVRSHKDFEKVKHCGADAAFVDDPLAVRSFSECGG